MNKECKTLEAFQLERLLKDENFQKERLCIGQMLKYSHHLQKESGDLEDCSN